MNMEYLGNKELMNLPKTAFLASSTIPPDMVLKCYDWATAKCAQGDCPHVHSCFIYSYELKRRIESDYQLKQYYFQALSNSSWANFGYLVAFEINDDLDEEMERLNNAFGIGIILMQVNDSKILYPAKEKQLDYKTIGKLNNLNPDFCEFIKKLSKVMNASKDYTSDARNSFEKICDKIFESDEEQEQYCKDNNIPF